MTVSVRTQTDSYPIFLERGGLAAVGARFPLNRRVLIVTDDGVPAPYVQTVKAACAEPTVAVIPQGETSKNLTQWTNLLQTLTDHHFTRTDCIVAVGGGVVGDLAGFAASCYMRGMDFYNIPTTLLSQLDSSIGGKTAVNFGGYKNTVGAFHAPKGVLIDSDTLATLPPRHIAAGLAEAVKMSLLGDPALFARFEADEPAAFFDEIIERSLRIKKAVVEQDETESGLRKILNFGHTLAHAIESESNGTLLHGECVALGMIPMCAPAVRARLMPVLRKLHLPTAPVGDPDRLAEAMRHDKKAVGNRITVILVDAPGVYRMETVSWDALEARIKEGFQ